MISIKTSDFYYELPEERIAQKPLDRRDASRLMTLDRRDGSITHRHFYELPQLLRPGDCLVLNDSRVLPARLLGQRLPGGGAAEVLLLHQQEEKLWECLVRPGRRLRVGAQVSFGGGKLTGTVEAVLADGNRLLRFSCAGPFLPCLETLGRMPLPPYIHETLQDDSRYQTVYARAEGSAAAPTAGLHFTPELLQSLRERGISTCSITLHVGLGTFRPVKEREIENHKMHREFYSIPEETVRRILATKEAGGRVICVGTTSCRTLESRAALPGGLQAGSGSTDIFLYPGCSFRVMDGLITNFHLPESTLLMLVSAFAGREAVLHAYQEAVRTGYRFFSFGDAMLLL